MAVRKVSFMQIHANKRLNAVIIKYFI